jgi:hypothetical protein
MTQYRKHTTCKPPSNPNKKAKARTVPWWTDSLTIMRTRTNALRRLYQRTKNNNDLRESRRNQYTKAKSEYQSAIKKGKKQYLGRNIALQHHRRTHGLRYTKSPQVKQDRR